MKTVYVGLSGGVDSSVAAALLKKQGFSVVGVYMKNWTQDIGGVACPWAEDLSDVRAAAAVLDIPFKVFDFQEQYRQAVVETMVSEYKAGRTPNPDVLCNQDIKFRLFLETALADGADMIATGHYARTEDGRLLKGLDGDKDQSYFLYRVTADALRQTLFPVGELNKPRVRELAREFGLPTAEKPDSQGICFVGEVGIRTFLQQYLVPQPGPVMHGDKRVGTHDGAAFYTIGQRQGLGTGGGQVYYVVRKDMASNTLFVTDTTASLTLEASRFTLEQCNWLGDYPQVTAQYDVRIRHRGKLTPATLSNDGSGWAVTLAAAERAVAIGQSAVIYDGETVLGGGIISAVIDTATVDMGANVLPSSLVQ